MAREKDTRGKWVFGALFVGLIGALCGKHDPKPAAVEQQPQQLAAISAERTSIANVPEPLASKHVHPAATAQPKHSATGATDQPRLTTVQKPAPAQDRSGSALLCCDGSQSPSCSCGGSHRGCCSHHGGVCGCSE
jgi:hypothetical protein